MLVVEDPGGGAHAGGCMEIGPVAGEGGSGRLWDGPNLLAGAVVAGWVRVELVAFGVLELTAAAAAVVVVAAAVHDGYSAREEEEEEEEDGARRPLLVAAGLVSTGEEEQWRMWVLKPTSV